MRMKMCLVKAGWGKIALRMNRKRRKSPSQKKSKEAGSFLEKSLVYLAGTKIESFKVDHHQLHKEQKNTLYKYETHKIQFI